MNIISAVVLYRYVVELTFDEEISSSLTVADFSITMPDYVEIMYPTEIHISSDSLKVHMTTYHMANDIIYTVSVSGVSGSCNFTYTGDIDAKVILFNRTPISGAVVDPVTVLSVDIVPQDCTITTDDVSLNLNGVDVSDLCDIAQVGIWVQLTYQHLQYGSDYTAQVIVNALQNTQES